jgi:hypothetical protein
VPSLLNAIVVAPPGWRSCWRIFQSRVERIVIAPEASLVASRLPSRLNALCLAGPAVGQLAASEAVIRGPVVAGAGPELLHAAIGSNATKASIERHIKIPPVPHA